MNKNHYYDYWNDRHLINIEPEKMDKYAADEGLFSEQPSERRQAIADALASLSNLRYRRLLEGLYHEHLSPKQLAKEMNVTLPNFYNLHRRALAALKKHLCSVHME